MNLKPQDLNFDSNGLLPVIVQNDETQEVLMLAYINADALELSLKTGQSHFWSRSREQLWHKGETSGNYQLITAIEVDCDGDALLLHVKPLGPACHTGSSSCFYRHLDFPDNHIDAHSEPADKLEAAEFTEFTLADLYQIIRNRIDHPRSGSYTNQLLASGEDEIVKKIGEEAIEVILAAKSQGDQRLVEEVADLVYHTLVLLASRQITPDAIRAELSSRHKS